jgi:hypothetical protein
MWLPSRGSLSGNTTFLKQDPDVTLTIPSTATRVVSVGAYDPKTLSYATFSGRGYTRLNEKIKPDIAAPGVDIVSAAPGGGGRLLSGTSMATPFVTGAMAMLMEWGIVRNNDPFLYGEKLKAYLIKGAIRDRNIQYPNKEYGWGRLCVKNSIFP